MNLDVFCNGMKIASLTLVTENPATWKSQAARVSSRPSAHSSGSGSCCRKPWYGPTPQSICPCNSSSPITSRVVVVVLVVVLDVLPVQVVLLLVLVLVRVVLVLVAAAVLVAVVLVVLLLLVVANY